MKYNIDTVPNIKWTSTCTFEGVEFIYTYLK